MTGQEKNNKLVQVLKIEPENELRFKGPFTSPVTSYMRLYNPLENKKVVFKIKTTAPKKYCVRPNSGILNPNSSIEVAICLQPFPFDPSEKNKHKFMVQSMFAPDGDVNLDQLWKDANPDNLMDSKLKCVFEVPDEQPETHEEQQTKASPKPVTTTTASVPKDSVPAELLKAAEEVQILREEESTLRQENLRLKEEILHLKAAVGQKSVAVNRYTPPAQQNNIPAVYVIIGICLAFLGIILGKFIL